MNMSVVVPLPSPSFDGEYLEWQGIRELKVAEGWRPWWIERGKDDKRPEYRAALARDFPYRVLDGEKAQLWFNNSATHNAGIWTVVEGIPVGAVVTFRVHAQVWTRIRAGDPRKSDGRYRVRVGIDPYGGDQVGGADIVWSEAIQPYDEYQPLEVSAETHADRVSVWIAGQPEWPGNNNDCYVDQAVLSYVDDALPPIEDPEGRWAALIEGLQALGDELGALAERLRGAL